MKMTKIAVTIALLFASSMATATGNDNDRNKNRGVQANANARATANANSNATNSSYIRTTIDNRNNNENSNSQDQNQKQDQKQEQKQEQKQDQKQDQKQSVENSNNASQSTIVGGSSMNFESSDNPVSSAYAPNVYPTAPCMGSTTGGAQTGVFGFSIGATWESKDCMMLETARSFEQAGYKEDALAIRCKSKYAKDAPSCKALDESIPPL